MDPIIVSTAATALRATVPEITRIMSTWLSRSTDQTVRLKIVNEGGIEVADLTPANTKAFLKTMEAHPIGGVTITDRVGTVGGDIVGGDKIIGSATPPILEAAPVTERPDPDSLKVSLIQETLARMHNQLIDELPRARSRERLVKRVRLFGSLAALVSNVGVLGALGFGNAAASIVAAVIALLVSGLKTVEDHLIAGVTGKEPHRLQAMVIESTRLSYEAAEVLNAFKQLNAVHASPKQYPVTDANRIAKDLLRILPEMEVVRNS